ncbi:hypothetical protein SVA_2556 [Sulfurifustis variabilis]|uniref:Uncharacterized protein n=1 Tax=Sulfurifustis variabilis TaxID=1675686 RepID=A0A1B4VAZ5_9GAMM|nr:hypothetical protein [Sulfurifustis variabilis]BAU49104.1 hypothetical protein SVA_2556 [Sulfurifustis variabilis]
MGSLLLTHDGLTRRLVGNPTDPASVQNARAVFEHLLSRNYAAFEKMAGRKRGRFVCAFNPAAEYLVMQAPPAFP